MRLPDISLLRDRAIKEEIYSSLTDQEQAKIIPLIETAFKKGSSVWAREYLPIAVGGKKAARQVLSNVRTLDV